MTWWYLQLDPLLLALVNQLGGGGVQSGPHEVLKHFFIFSFCGHLTDPKLPSLPFLVETFEKYKA